ncbi:TIR domain-containing protein [Streptomyces sp. NPDC054863]
MADVFINYRTGDGDEFATTLERELSRRFGTDRIFRASKSIVPGTPFDEELLRSVRRSSVLLVLAGPDWESSARLHDAQDWVRSEILEAFDSAVDVVPILVGRRTERLRPETLPDVLKKLAARQSLRYDNQNAESGLRDIGDFLASRVPQLAKAERELHPDTSRAPEPGSVHHSMGDNSGTAVQTRDVTGGVHLGPTATTHIARANGPVHSGSGDMHIPHFTGDGALYIAGDNQGGIQQSFGTKKRRKGDSR